MTVNDIAVSRDGHVACDQKVELNCLPFASPSLLQTSLLYPFSRSLILTRPPHELQVSSRPRLFLYLSPRPRPLQALGALSNTYRPRLYSTFYLPFIGIQTGLNLLVSFLLFALFCPFLKSSVF